MSLNDILANRVLQEMLDIGVKEFCLCFGGRNAPLSRALVNNTHIKTHFWHEERSASFFALGRCRALKGPVAVLVTSGTAAGELLPAAMEAHYSEIPLLLVTADRPRRYRYSGAPQTAEQRGLYGQYAHYAVDIEYSEPFSLKEWDQRGACHVNVCFEEPKYHSEALPLIIKGNNFTKKNGSMSKEGLERFLDQVSRPLVVVSTLEERGLEKITQFLLKLNAPVYLEGISNLREEKKLQSLRVYNPDLSQGFFDSVLRIGGVPTIRLWRDLEEAQFPVYSISETPFSGLSFANVTTTSLCDFFSGYNPPKCFDFYKGSEWEEQDHIFRQELEELFSKEPQSEANLFRELSSLIPRKALIYLGNSMPIRYWDLAAEDHFKKRSFYATRGLNGIDGQLSYFFGLCDPTRPNWAILGDLTTLYDLSAPWILHKLEVPDIKIVVINNFGGRIFARKFIEVQIQNSHQVRFEHLAKLWKLSYQIWENQIPENVKIPKRAIIEINPDYTSTERFWARYRRLKRGTCLAVQ